MVDQDQVVASQPVAEPMQVPAQIRLDWIDACTALTDPLIAWRDWRRFYGLGPAMARFKVRFVDPYSVKRYCGILQAHVAELDAIDARCLALGIEPLHRPVALLKDFDGLITALQALNTKPKQ